MLLLDIMTMSTNDGSGTWLSLTCRSVFLGMQSLQFNGSETELHSLFRAAKTSIAAGLKRASTKIQLFKVLICSSTASCHTDGRIEKVH